MRATSSRPFVTFTSAVALAACNPKSVLRYAALCAAWATEGRAVGPLPAANLAVGVFAGALLWWVLLSNTVHYFQRRLFGWALPWVNRLSGALIVGIGA